MKGIKVSDFIRPLGVNDTYPTNLDVFGKGGIHSVSSLLDRDAITFERRSKGMLAFTAEDKTFYSLLDGVENQNWIKLFGLNEQNKLDFEIFCPENYALVGNRDQIARPSPVLIDMRQDIIDLRRNIDKLEVLDKLDYNRIWIGNYTNRREQRLQIGVINLPTLGAALFPEPTGLLEIAIPNPTFNHLSASDWIMSGPWLPQIFAGKADATDILTLNPSNPRTTISSSLAMTQINAIQALKRLDNANFIVKSKKISWAWENLKMLLVPRAIKSLYNLNEEYTFSNAQALDELQTGLLLNTQGVLSKAIPGKDYVDVAASVDNMKLALIRPLLQDEQGQDISKFLSRVDKLPMVNMPDLTTGKIWQGINNRATEVTLSEAGIADRNATYILQTPNANLPNSQGLSALSILGGILKCNGAGVVSIASGGKTPIANDYVTPTDLQTEITAVEGEIAAVQTNLEAQLATLTGYSILTELINVIGGVTYVAYAINNTKLVINDDIGIFSSTFSHMEGSGYLNSDGLSSKKVAVKLKQNVNFENHDQRFSFGSNNEASQLVINTFTRNNDNVHPLKLGFFTSERKLDLWQPSGDYMIDRGFFFESTFGFDSNISKPNRFSLKMLKYRDDKTYYSEPTEIDIILEYNRETEGLSFFKNIILPIIKKADIPLNPPLGMVLLVEF